MTLTLIVMRHAKADPGGADVADHDRPLAPRGRADAAAMGAWLDRQDIAPDLALVSTARRTMQTWEGVAGAMASAPPVRFDRRLYDATTETVRDVLAASGAATVLVIGHNPTMAALAHDLSRPAPDHGKFARYPTGAATVLRFVADDWAEIALGTPLAFAVPGDLSGRGSG